MSLRKNENFLSYTSFIIYILALIYLYIVEIINFGKWWDLTGYVLSASIPPLVVIFPIICWIKEGVFPKLYFTIWSIGHLGLILSLIIKTYAPNKK